MPVNKVDQTNYWDWNPITLVKAQRLLSGVPLGLHNMYPITWNVYDPVQSAVFTSFITYFTQNILSYKYETLDILSRILYLNFLILSV